MAINPEHHSPIKHSMLRRAPWHNYTMAGQYMVTLVAKDRTPWFGCLVSEPQPTIVPSVYGQMVMNEEIPKMAEHYPNIDLLKFCMMPDHLHLIIRVRQPFMPGRHLGSVIRGFKSGCNKALRKAFPNMGYNSIFEANYHDRIIIDANQLAQWEKYIDDNPRRLWLKQQHPDLFTVLRQQTVANYDCQMVGNCFLLDNPDKMAIIVHRHYSADELQMLVNQWLACGERGGVLVSAAVAQREREIMRIAMDRGYNLIFLRENGFAPLYKPSGESFDACVAGRLLQISPWEYHYDHRTITREQCLYLNAMAEAIAANSI